MPVAETLLPHGCERLVDRIQTAIRSQLGPSADQIQIDADEGVVTLLGTTTSYYQRQLAVHAARKAANEWHLVDELQVVYPRRR